jgi:acetoin utilization deacetylase AcuC-like enzyme
MFLNPNLTSFTLKYRLKIWQICKTQNNLLYHRSTMAAIGLYFFLYSFLLATFLKGVQALAAVPVFFDSNNHHHRDLRYHPEQPLRISSCVEALDKFRRENPNHLLELIDVTTGTTTPIEGVHTIHQPFSEEELNHARDMLLLAHTDDLVTKLEERSLKSREQRIQEGKPALGHMGNIDADTYVTTESFNVCLRATAAWIRAVDVAEANGEAAMALTRPPGHHAEKGVSNGFCLYNFAAAAALHVLQDPNKKVSILDWDVHFGQGVKDILMSNSRARYVSIHQSPAFPFMGENLQTHGEHQNVLTIPMPAETTWTCGYKHLYEKALDFVCKPGEWEPDVVIVCAGYDALDSDELASVSLNAQDFGRMTRRLSEHLGEATSKRPALIFGLEGGYQLSKMAGGGGLTDAVVETVRALTL